MATAREFMKITGAGEKSDLAIVAEMLCKDGWAVVPVAPMNKNPLCTMHQAERNRADKAAVEQGKYKHDCGIHEFITDPKAAKRIFDRMAKGYEGMRMNLGVVAHPSRVVLVDCDTLHSVDEFRRDWAEAEGDPAYLHQTPTVLTPGVQEPDGSWHHRDGGHWYFSLPDGLELPVVPGFLKSGEGGYDVKWGMSQSLVPPSVRKEGPYKAKGELLEVPEWLIKKIMQRIHDDTLYQNTKGTMYPNDVIAQWSVGVEWADLLLADGWTDPFKTDNCGCPVFTRPGGATTSYKSATGHSGHCPKFENVEQHGPLHVWSTEAPAPLEGGRTYTKLQYVILVRHGGDDAAAMEALGLEWGPTSESIDELLASMGVSVGEAPADVLVEAPPVEAPPKLEAVVDDVWSQPVEITEDAEDEPESGGIADMVHNFFDTNNVPERWMQDILNRNEAKKKNRLADMLSTEVELYEKTVGAAESAVHVLTADELVAMWHNPTRVVPTIGQTTKGDSLLYPGRLSSVSGEPGTGKSWLSLSLVDQVLRSGGSAFVIDFEDNPAFSLERLRILGMDLEPYLRAGLLRYMGNDRTYDKSDFELLMRRVEEFKSDLVVLDSANALVSQFGAIEDNNLVTQLYKRMSVAADKSGSAFLVVDHLPKRGENRRPIGAQAKEAALTGTSYIMAQMSPFSPGKEGTALLTYTKDRPGGVAQHSVDKQTCLMRLGPSMVAPVGMTPYDGMAAVFEPIPEGGVDMDGPGAESAISASVEDYMKNKAEGNPVTRKFVLNGIPSRHRKDFPDIWKVLIDEGQIEAVEGLTPTAYVWVGQKELES